MNLLTDKQLMKNMVYKWNFVTTKVFKDIFETYWNGNGNEDKVLELQNFISAEDEDGVDARVFFGKKLFNIDSKYLSPENLEVIQETNKFLSDELGESINVFDHSNISMCAADVSVNITPIRTDKEKLDLIYNGILDYNLDSITDAKFKVMAELSRHWFRPVLYKGKNDVYKLNGKGERYVRVRTMDYKDWENNIKSFVSNGGNFDDEFTKNDINL